MKQALLHIEVLPGDQLNLKIKNFEEVSKMIWEVCHQRPDIAIVFICGVVGYCRENHIPWEKMEELAEKNNITVNRGA